MVDATRIGRIRECLNLIMVVSRQTDCVSWKLFASESRVYGASGKVSVWQAFAGPRCLPRTVGDTAGTAGSIATAPLRAPRPRSLRAFEPRFLGARRHALSRLR